MDSLEGALEWVIQDGSAVWEGIMLDQNGDPKEIRATVLLVEDPESLWTGDWGKDGPPEDALEYQPGLYLRVRMDDVPLLTMELEEGADLGKFAEQGWAASYVMDIMESVLPHKLRVPYPVNRLEQMGQQPGCPGTERVRAALRALTAEERNDEREVPPGSTLEWDLEGLYEFVDAGTFGERAAAAMEELTRRGETAQDAALRVCWEADTPEGIALLMEGPGETCSVHMLLRRRDWTGMNEELTRAEGRHAIIVESRKRPGEPGMVIITDEEPGARPGPVPGNARRLAEILEAHGCLSCRWLG